MPQPPLQRRRYRFYGQVQGVGFRYRARSAAGLLGLTGWVENLPDGSVALEAQGAPDALDKLPQTITRGSAWIEIAHLTVEPLPPDPAERGFATRGW